MSLFSLSNMASKFNYVTDESWISSKTIWTTRETGTLPPIAAEKLNSWRVGKERKELPEKQGLTLVEKSTRTSQSAPQAERGCHVNCVHSNLGAIASSSKIFCKKLKYQFHWGKPLN